MKLHTPWPLIAPPWLLANAGALLLCASAAAQESDGLAEFDEPANALSVKLAWLQITSAGESAALRRLGISLSYERELIAGWLEGEVSVLLAPGQGGLTLPVDILLKKPFELSPSTEVFVGLGLASEWFEAGERETGYGIGTQAGGQYCLAPRLAVAVEAEYNLLLHPDTAHEVVIPAGGAFRF